MKGKVLLLGSEGLGRGDDALGGLIMGNFLRTLSESPDKPKTIVCWNTAVRLVAEGSKVLEHLRRLEQTGVEILACQTCLNSLGLEDKVMVGRISGMHHFVDLLMYNEVVSV